MIPSKTIFEFAKSCGERVRISLTEFKGKKYLAIWVFYDASENETPDWKPSKKGLCLSIDLLDELREGIERAMVAAGVDDGQGDAQDPQTPKDQSTREGAACPRE